MTRKVRNLNIGLWVIVGGSLLSYPQSSAAQDGISSASVMWGTGSSSVSGAMQSAVMHERNGVSAAQVNAAELGLLLGQSAINMTAIGSQTIVSVEIVGHDNDVDIDADQTATNSGDQSVDGTIVLHDPMIGVVPEPAPPAPAATGNNENNMENGQAEE